ncbi:restriction endonuclease subunit S [Agrobacterium vitis]|uniref:restriction endonuclease subunit S n=1 Tax=Agrobacterium vitis TaxID=373 RepID=UPI0018D908D1|nr:restriction endonuclease subunit S [Agrobacterium vitis]
MSYETARLGDFVTFSNGRSSPERTGGGEFAVFGSNGPIGRSGDCNAPPLTTVIGRVGTYCGSVHFSKHSSWVTDNAIKAIANQQDEGRFWHYALLMADLGRLRSGSGQPLINQRSLNSVELPVPPRCERLRIAEVLGSLDDKIELNRRMNETLEAMAQAIFRDWFVDFGPTRRKLEGAADPLTIMGGLVQDAERAQALADLFPAALGDDGLPEGWKVAPIGDLTDIVGGSTPSTADPSYWNGGYHAWATPKDLSNLDGLVLFETERRLTDAGLKKITSGLSPEGTVLLSSRAPIGYLAIAATKVAVNQGFIAIRPSVKLPTSYALFWCKENMDLIKANANGSTFMEISKRNFRPLPVVLPTAQIMQIFVDLVDPMFSRIEMNLRNSRTLSETRDLLLPKLMSGQLRVGTNNESSLGSAT